MGNVDWQPYLEKIDLILDDKKQDRLSQNEKQNIVNTWQSILMQPQIPFLLKFQPQMAEITIKRDLSNVVYDVLKASRGDKYK